MVLVITFLTILFQFARADDCFSIDSGFYENCAISNGAITCWGYDGYGQVSNAPTQTDFVSVSGMRYHNCGMHSSGAITCWGRDSHGQVSGTPTDTGFVAVSTGGYHTCGLRSTGSITCWGSNSYGLTTPPTHTDFIAISSGGYHSCGLRSSGAIECWGRDVEAQVSNTPTQTDFVAMSSGWQHNCGLKSNGAITCWGYNGHGEVSQTPTDTDFVAVSSGTYYNCGLRSSGAIKCWGLNNYGQVGSTPTDTDFVAVSAGYYHTCGLRKTGAITCWGRDSEGQVSNAPTQNDFICEDYVRRTGLGYVDDFTCEWHEINIMNKVINSERFFGFECPENQIMSDLRLLGTGEGSVLNNNPTAVSCCELGGYSKVTDNCIDSFSNAAGGLETAMCGGNSAMVAIYDLSDPTLQQSQWQYQSTKGITCCDIEYDTALGENRDLGIDRSDCEVISHSSPVGSFDVACPRDMVLVEIRDNDPAHGVQEVHEIECCRVHDFEAPTQAPTSTPSTSEPSRAPTTSCYACLAQVYETEVSNKDAFVTQVQSCLSHCCVEH